MLYNRSFTLFKFFEVFNSYKHGLVTVQKRGGRESRSWGRKKAFFKLLPFSGISQDVRILLIHLIPPSLCAYNYINCFLFLNSKKWQFKKKEKILDMIWRLSFKSYGCSSVVVFCSFARGYFLSRSIWHASPQKVEDVLRSATSVFWATFSHFLHVLLNCKKRKKIAVIKSGNKTLMHGVKEGYL